MVQAIPRTDKQKAIRECREYLNAGYVWTVDMDLEKFFDTVNQSKLLEFLSRTFRDGRIILFIFKYLRSGIVICERFENTEVGVPQGGALSPLLTNNMLNELDMNSNAEGTSLSVTLTTLQSSAKNRRTDAETHPYGLPEEMEKVQNKVPEPQAVGIVRE